MFFFSEDFFFLWSLPVPLKRKDITYVYVKKVNFLVLQEKTKEISTNQLAKFWLRVYVLDFCSTYTLKLVIMFTLAEQPPEGRNFKLVKHL